MAQANFLGRVLTPSLLVLSEENDDAAQRDRIRVFGPSWLDRSAEIFDVALNADSITEMDRGHATAYFEKLASHADVFISINHEANSFCAKDLPVFAGVLHKPLRYPYWLDDSYVEETFIFRNRAPADPDAEAEIKRLGRMIADLRQRTAAMDSVRALVCRLIHLTRHRLTMRSPP